MAAIDRSPLLLGSGGSPAPSPSSRQRLALIPSPQLGATGNGQPPLRSSSPPSTLSSPSFSASLSSLSPSPPSTSSMVLSRYHSRHSTVVLSLILLLLLVLYVQQEPTLLTGSNSPVLPPASLASLNNVTTTQSYFGPDSLASNTTHRTRVIYCIIDGLRYDALTSHPPLSAFVSSLAPDALVLPVTNQLPTISIPNWITLLTGVSPTFHGRSGNDVTSTLPFSSVFSSLAGQGRPNGLSASHWWSDLLAPQLTPFRGDGTYVEDLDWGEDESRRGDSSAVRDAFATARLLQAVRSQHRRDGLDSRFDYEMFLAYWDDVDAESHAWGATSSETAQAVATIVGDIGSAMAAVRDADQWSVQQGGVQWQSIWVITSDHGHVDVGGHGGDVPVLTTVPLIVYANGSGLANRTTQLPPPPPSYVGSTVDIATTIAALCGVPVPRQSEGMFMTEVLGAFLDVGPRAWFHWFDLFMQKRALVMEAVGWMGEGHLLSAELTAMPPPPAINNVSASLTDLSDRVGRLLEVLREAKEAQLDSQLAVNWTVSTLLTALVLFPLLYWVFDRRTFITVSAVLPQGVSAAVFHGWYLVRACLVRSWRRVGGHAALPSSAFLPPTADALRVNRVAAFAAFVLTVTWLLVMVFEFLVVFRFAYRPDPEWTWQFTLFNSHFDAYVLIFAFCISASLVVCVALHVAMGFALSSTRVMGPILAYVPVVRGKVSEVSAEAAAGGKTVPRVPKKVLVYFVSVWSSLWSGVLTLLFLFSQSYHCLLLPSWLSVSDLTPSLWKHRFQSMNFAFMLLVLQLYTLALAAWVDFRLHQLMWRTLRDSEEEEAMEGAEARKRQWMKRSETWRREKDDVLWELGRLKGVDAAPAVDRDQPT